MYSSSGRGPLSASSGKSIAQANTKDYEEKEGWAANIHLNKEQDPAIISKLQAHNQLLAEHDKFIDYIKHVESK